MPEPSATPIPEPTATPIPPTATATVEPTATPVPTTTPEPTATTVPTATSTPVPPSPEEIALSALYRDLGGESWVRNDGWLSDTPFGEWYGVTTEGDRVVAITLRDNGLRGELPAEIGGLADLRSLDLEGNSVSGEIPEEIGSLSRLRELNLSGTC